MEQAATGSASGMAALVGGDEATAQAITAQRRSEGGRLWVANLNAPGQIVVAGGAEDISWLTDNGRDLGVRRVIPLKVAGAFHSPIMQPAAQALRAALDDVDFGEPQFAVYANTTAAPIEDIPAILSEQLTSPVRFADSLVAMATDGVEVFIHVGPGDVTAGMAKRTVKDATILTISSLDEVAAAAATLAVQ